MTRIRTACRGPQLGGKAEVPLHPPKPSKLTERLHLLPLISPGQELLPRVVDNVAEVQREGGDLSEVSQQVDSKGQHPNLVPTYCPDPSCQEVLGKRHDTV